MTTTPLTAGLVARTRPVEPAGDLLQALAPDGFAWLFGDRGFVTSGVVARIPAADAPAVLADIDVDDVVKEPGTGAMAVGALPFAGTADGELVVPSRVAGIATDGRAWVTEIGHPVAARAPWAPAPSRFTVESPLDRSQWRSQVLELLEAIEHGRLGKAVLARDVLVTANAPFDARVVLDRLRRSQRGCFVFASGGFVGATPELLVARSGAAIECRPMAGTIARPVGAAAGERAERAFARSAKEGLEHRLVVEAVVDGLRSHGVEVDRVGEPEVARLVSMSHLATRIVGHLPAGRDATAPSALDLALALHPTPAVGGSPRGAALDALRALESFDRGCYGGPVGWVGAGGDGEWAVALRCAELTGSRARLFAGAGIVAGSDPDAEWAETQAKLEPMLDALVRP